MPVPLPLAEKNPALPRTLDGVLARQASLRPEALALRFEGLDLKLDITYCDLHHRTERAAARLWHEWGVRAGDRVAWLGANHADQLTLLFALARIGAMLVPLNFRLAGAEWDAVTADCSPVCLLHDDAWRDAARTLALRHGMAVHDVAMLVKEPADAVVPSYASAEAPALLVYTSGTTGLPKGAVHTQGNLLANMAAACEAQGLQPSDTVATVLPMFHVGGLCIQTLPALYAGARVLLHPRFDPSATLACIAQDRPSLTLLVPAVMKALIEHPGWAATDLSSLRAVWAGSSTLPRALVDAFHARGVPVCNVYGATETGPFSIALGAQQAFSHAGSCGWPARGVEVRLANAKDGVGEVLVRAPNVAQRYWPDTPAVDADGWFHSGDLAQCAADGSYTVVGRIKDMIISGGENIYPAEIENLLATHPAVAECAVVGLPDEKWGEVVVAAVVLCEGHAMGDEELLAWLRPLIARYKLPRRVVWLEALPKTALGKVQKAALTRQLA